MVVSTSAWSAMAMCVLSVPQARVLVVYHLHFQQPIRQAAAVRVVSLGVPGCDRRVAGRHYHAQHVF